MCFDFLICIKLNINVKDAHGQEFSCIKVEISNGNRPLLGYWQKLDTDLVADSLSYCILKLLASLYDLLHLVCSLGLSYLKTISQQVEIIMSTVGNRCG